MCWSQISLSTGAATATLVLRLLFFEKFAGAPLGQKHKYGMEVPIARVKTKNILNLRIGFFKAPLSYVD